MSSKTSSRGPNQNAADRVVQARLSGRSERLDPRVHAVRADLADIALAGRVIAPRYSAPVEMRCSIPVAALRGESSSTSTQVSELLFGEVFAVFDRVGGWAWGQAASDSYIGWVDATALGVVRVDATHVVGSPAASRFTLPSLKSPIADVLPLGARVTLQDAGGDYLRCDDGYWIHRRHIVPPTGDIVDLALGFIGTPYHWGGRTRSGIDCSGLVQTVLRAHGVWCPRDADQQLAALPAAEPGSRRRGDLVFVPGHVGLLVDAGQILHANAYWMTTLVEPLDALLDRLESRDFKVARPCGGMAVPL